MEFTHRETCDEDGSRANGASAAALVPALHATPAGMDEGGQEAGQPLWASMGETEFLQPGWTQLWANGASAVLQHATPISTDQVRETGELLWDLMGDTEMTLPCMDQEDRQANRASADQHATPAGTGLDIGGQSLWGSTGNTEMGLPGFGHEEMGGQSFWSPTGDTGVGLDEEYEPQAAAASTTECALTGIIDGLLDEVVQSIWDPVGEYRDRTVRLMPG